MDPATVTAAIVMGRAAVAAGADAYALFKSLIRSIPGLDVGRVEKEVHTVDTAGADAAVQGELEKLGG